MLTALLLQLFGDDPRRETGVYLLLTGKRTVSVLYAGLRAHILQWLLLYPTLARADYQAAIAQLIRAGALVKTDSGLIVTDKNAQVRAAQVIQLPAAYRPWMGMTAFDQRLTLAVQAVSENGAGVRHYRPAVSDWGVQQQVRRWYQGTQPRVFADELQGLFEALPQDAGDVLAAGFIGHAFVGSAQADLATQMRRTQALAQLVTRLDEDPQRWPQTAALWGGRQPIFPRTQTQIVDLLDQGFSREAIGQRLGVRPSTVNEHLLTAAIMGQALPLEGLYPAAIKHAFDQVPDPTETNYQTLLSQVPASDFFQVRLFQILQFQGRWPGND
ncbi:helix-turn-helix domain-containing protein [Lacticaseibacillus mingshuiensis]|uniref:Helix-turn-helix domain-containing protein n=1 Tax=Lacticaseibacillus mingshuiensis TaxID=2799574 RepID=A0ABW4CH35_9LACO|nr:helix-turn-helix domain-containing protein [Lacticaseibacillus mingshuiensis]